MKKLCLTLVCASLAAAGWAQIYSLKSGQVSFFSAAPLENIEAANKNVVSLINSAKNEITFKVPINKFIFANGLMQEHFNEKYMESEKYPDATFKGKINETIDWAKDSVYQVTVTGKLNIHGVEKDVTEKGTVTIKGGQVTVDAVFKVALKDYNITVPSMLFKNIAEVVEVKLNAAYVPYVPKK